MLVELSKRVVEHLERQKLVEAKDEDAKHIGNTNEALKALLFEITALQRRIRLIGRRLELGTVQNVERDAAKLSTELRQSRITFLLMVFISKKTR